MTHVHHWYDGSGDRDPEILGRAGATEAQGEAGGRKEGAGGTEQQGAAGGAESWGRWWVDARPRRSRRDEGARWIDGLCGDEGARSRVLASEAEVRDTQTVATEDGTVPQNSHYIDGGLRVSRAAARWQRWRRQEWGHSWASGLSGLPSRIKAHSWMVLRTDFLTLLDWAGRRREERGQIGFQLSFPVNKVPLEVQQSQMYDQLTFSCGEVGGAPLRALKVHGLLPHSGHCRQLSHLVWQVKLCIRGNPLLSRSALRANSRNSLVWSSSDLSPCSCTRRRNSGRMRGSIGHIKKKKTLGKQTEGKTRRIYYFLSGFM